MTIDVEDYFTADLIVDLSTKLKADISENSALGIESALTVLAQRASWPEARHRIFEVAADALREAGEEGVTALAGVVRGKGRPTQRRVCLQALWALSLGRPPRVTTDIPITTVSSSVQEASRAALSDLVVESLSDLSVAETFWAEMASPAATGATEHLATFYIRVAGEAQIALTERLIETFEGLVRGEHGELAFQDFLTAHPSLLEVTAAEVIPLAPLGLEFKTDFVLRRHDGRYIVVEIEKPQDRIFTKGVDFTKEFTHAVGQVIDFQQWVAENVAYAEKHFPGISTPDGVVVIGRRADLDERRKRKLERWQFNSRSIEILAFDDLSTRARHILESLRRPL